MHIIITINDLELEKQRLLSVNEVVDEEAVNEQDKEKTHGVFYEVIFVVMPLFW